MGKGLDRLAQQTHRERRRLIDGLFAIPRTASWLAHFIEMLEQNSKISRPRQLYAGVEERAYVPLEAR